MTPTQLSADERIHGRAFKQMIESLCASGACSVWVWLTVGAAWLSLQPDRASESILDSPANRRGVFPEGRAPRYLIRDRYGVCGERFRDRVTEVLTAHREKTPWRTDYIHRRRRQFISSGATPE